jgi:hypothetical protein
LNRRAQEKERMYSSYGNTSSVNSLYLFGMFAFELHLFSHMHICNIKVVDDRLVQRTEEKETRLSSYILCSRRQFVHTYSCAAMNMTCRSRNDDNRSLIYRTIERHRIMFTIDCFVDFSFIILLVDLDCPLLSYENKRTSAFQINIT